MALRCSCCWLGTRLLGRKKIHPLDSAVVGSLSSAIGVFGGGSGELASPKWLALMLWFSVPILVHCQGPFSADDDLIEPPTGPAGLVQ